jgi:hypothetical protein
MAIAKPTSTPAPASKKSLSLKLPPALGSYANLFEPKEIEGSTSGPKYGICLLWPATEPALAQLRAAIEEVAVKKFGPAAKDWLKQPGNRFKNPLRDGTTEKPADPFYAGKLFMNASSKRQPGIAAVQMIGGEKKLVKIYEEEEAYSGCTFIASVSLYAFEKAGNRGVGVGLNNLLVVKKGERLAGRSVESDFADFVDEGAAVDTDPIG